MSGASTRIRGCALRIQLYVRSYLPVLRLDDGDHREVPPFGSARLDRPVVPAARASAHSAARQRNRFEPSGIPSQRFYLQTPDRKSTRLNSSHSSISYAVFCLKKKKKIYLELHFD